MIDIEALRLTDEEVLAIAYDPDNDPIGIAVPIAKSVADAQLAKLWLLVEQFDLRSWESFKWQLAKELEAAGYPRPLSEREKFIKALKTTNRLPVIGERLLPEQELC